MSARQAVVRLKAVIERLQERNANQQRDRTQMAERLGKYRRALKRIATARTTDPHARSLAVEALRRKPSEPRDRRALMQQVPLTVVIPDAFGSQP